MKPSWWISEDMYCKLRRYCSNYEKWKMALDDIDSFAGRSSSIMAATCDDVNDITFQKASYRKAMTERINLLITCAKNSDKDIGRYILEGATVGTTYEDLKEKYELSVSKEEYYSKYRKFFYLLAKKLYA